MPIEAIRLYFSSPLHIGRGATDLDKAAAIYHSDALKSAIYAVGLPCYPGWGTAPDSYFNSFQISSAFPFCGEEYFIPKPYYQMQFAFASTAEEKQAKRAKKISFVSADIFRLWLQNPQQKIPADETLLSPDGSYLFSNAKNTRKFLYSEVQQRVRVPVEDEANTRPFYFDRVYFKYESGLYFLAQFGDETIREQVLHVLKILGDQGIGTDRSVGNGLFEFDAARHIQPFMLPQSQSSGLYLNLGLYLPTRQELSTMHLEKSYWQLIKRGGYLAGSSYEQFLSLRKNSIYFFAEGSVFGAGSVPQGCYVNLQPQFNDADMHPVYRCGQPLLSTFKNSSCQQHR